MVKACWGFGEKKDFLKGAMLRFPLKKNKKTQRKLKFAVADLPGEIKAFDSDEAW